MALTFNKPTGGFVQLKCDADGRPTPRVEWLKNSLPFKEKSRQIGKVRQRRGQRIARGPFVCSYWQPHYNL